MIRFTELADRRAYPATWVSTEGIVNIDNKDIVSGVIVWLAIIAIFAIF